MKEGDTTSGDAEHGPDHYDHVPDFENRVGHCSPPKDTQWKKGFCPNPYGRPRKSETRRQILERIASHQVEVKISDEIRQATTLEAIILVVRSKAVMGNSPARRLFEKLIGIPVVDEENVARKGVLLWRGEMTREEWLAEFSHLGDPPKSGTVDDSS